jgi:molybdate transport system substrate-binding protein
VASGAVALGFQQLSELMFASGITVIGPLPEAVQITTTFSAALGVQATHPDAARAFLAFLTSPDASEDKRRNGMQPASINSL